MNGEGGDIRRSHHPADAEPGRRRWPERYEYRLTPKGRDLSIALAGLRQWGDNYISQKPPRITRRKSDKHPALAAFVPEGAEVLRADEIETVPGPGAPDALRPARSPEINTSRRVHVTTATTKTHVSRLRAKPSARDRALLVIAACESGLIQPG